MRSGVNRVGSVCAVGGSGKRVWGDGGADGVGEEDALFDDNAFRKGNILNVVVMDAKLLNFFCYLDDEKRIRCSDITWNNEVNAT
jgi:hypothetical protein